MDAMCDGMGVYVDEEAPNVWYCIFEDLVICMRLWVEGGVGGEEKERAYVEVMTNMLAETLDLLGGDLSRSIAGSGRGGRAAMEGVDEGGFLFGGDEVVDEGESEGGPCLDVWVVG